MNEQVKEFIDAIQSGSGSIASELFNELMSQKVISAIDTQRTEIASNLFKTEAVIPGSVKKDKDGNIASGKTIPDVHHGKDNEKKHSWDDTDKDSLATLIRERPSRKMKKD